MSSINSNHSLGLVLTCPICENEFPDDTTSIRILHDTQQGRKHTMCVTCIGKLIEDGKSTCPFCRSEFTTRDPYKMEVYERGSSENDASITNLKKVVQASEFKHCTDCEYEALSLCFTCRKYLCENCKEHHQMINNRKNQVHEVKDLASLSGDERAKFQPVVLCKKHGLELNRYCELCKQVCCSDHDHDQLRKLSDVLKEKREKIKKDGTVALRKKPAIENSKVKWEKRKRTLEKNTLRSKDAIDLRVKWLCTTAIDKGDKLLQDITNGNDRLLDDCDSEILSRHNVLVAIESVETFFEDKTGPGDGQELEVYLEIERALQAHDLGALEAPPVDEEEGYSFIPSNTQSLDVGRIQGPLETIGREDRASTIGSVSDVADDEIRVLLLGRKRSGRIKTLAVLLTQAGLANDKEHSGSGIGKWRKHHKNHTYLLSKTPGIDASKDRNLDLEKSDVATVTSPGPHVLVLIIKIPDEDISVLDTYRQIFSDDLLPFLMIVFTGKKELDKRAGNISIYARNRTGDLGQLLSGVGKRFIAVNVDDKASHHSFREDTFKMIQNVYTENHNAYLPLRR